MGFPASLRYQKEKLIKNTKKKKRKRKFYTAGNQTQDVMFLEQIYLPLSHQGEFVIESPINIITGKVVTPRR